MAYRRLRSKQANLNWSYCFFCSVKIVTDADGANTRSSRFGQGHQVLLKYLLMDPSLEMSVRVGFARNLTRFVNKNYPPPVEEVKEGCGVAGRGTCFNIQFCSECDQLGNTLQELGLMVEEIQRKMGYYVTTMRKDVLRSSRRYGGDNEVQERFQKFETELDQREKAGICCEREREFLDLLSQFQTFVFENAGFRTSDKKKLVRFEDATLTEETENITLTNEPMDLAEDEEMTLGHEEQEWEPGDTEMIVDIDTSTDCIPEAQNQELGVGDAKCGQEQKVTDVIIANENNNDCVIETEITFGEVKCEGREAGVIADETKGNEAVSKTDGETRDDGLGELIPNLENNDDEGNEDSDYRMPSEPEASDTEDDSSISAKSISGKSKPPASGRKRGGTTFTRRVSRRARNRPKEFMNLALAHLADKMARRGRGLPKNLTDPTQLKDKDKLPRRGKSQSNNLLMDLAQLKDKDKIDLREYGDGKPLTAKIDKWDCEVCGVNVRCGLNGFLLEEHLRQHETSETSFECDLCNIKFTHKQYFAAHLLFTHRGEQRSKCDVCGTYIIQCKMSAHLRTHSNKVYYCHKCSFSFGKFHNLVAHLQLHTAGDEIQMKCELCPEDDSKVYDARASLPAHVMDCHELKHVMLFKCSTCSESFFNDSSRNLHELQYHIHPTKDVSDSDKLTCNVCPELTFQTPRLLKVHRFQSHGIGKAITMNKKRRRSKDNNSYINPSDSTKMKTSDVNTFLKTNFRFIYKRNEDGYLYCTVCNKTFEAAYPLSSHYVLAHGYPNYECKHCPGKSFPCFKSLANHYRHAHQQFQFQCSYCPMLFRERPYLTKHELIHTATKEFACDKCEFRTTTKCLLKAHSFKHATEAEKEHLCSYCPMRFARKEVLVVHLRRHTGEKPYKCGYCEAAFSQLTPLKVHTKSKHKGLPLLQRAATDVTDGPQVTDVMMDVQSAIKVETAAPVYTPSVQN